MAYDEEPVMAMPIKTSTEAGYGATVKTDGYVSASMEAVRLGFIRKVYSVLIVQLALTTFVSAVCCLHTPTRHFVLTNPHLLTLGLVLSLVLLVALLCFKDRYPTNIVLLSAWTFVEAYTIGVVTASYADRGQGLMVVQAGGLTLFIFSVLTVYTWTSKTDFSFMGPMLFSCLMGMILYSLVAWLFHLPTTGLIYSCFGALVFSGYIVYDTYLILQRLGPDDWILGAISLYLDIINLFLYILQILGSSRD
jgi:protein lifeguard